LTKEKTVSIIRPYVETFSQTVANKAKVLDVGCGSSPYKLFFAHAEYVGIDVEESGRNHKQKTPDRYYDGIHFPFNDGEFDVVLCTQVLEHCIEPEITIREISRVLKPEGKLFLTVPFIWGEHEVPFDFRRYSSFGIRRLLEQSSMSVIRQEKLAAGVEAITMLVDSEINQYRSRHSGLQDASFISVIFGKFLLRVLPYVTRIQKYIWNKLFVFERIYIDNLVIAQKPGLLQSASKNGMHH
jgi:2-polyprenyl-3-methyl-5-hydroxy-6-metoxy-1,4-benzoquinol methylase